MWVSMNTGETGPPEVTRGTYNQDVIFIGDNRGRCTLHVSEDEARYIAAQMFAMVGETELARRYNEMRERAERAEARFWRSEQRYDELLGRAKAEHAARLAAEAKLADTAATALVIDNERMAAEAKLAEVRASVAEHAVWARKSGEWTCRCGVCDVARIVDEETNT